MAEEKVEATASAPAAASGSKGGTIKTLIMIVVVLLLEGGTITATMMLVGGPKQVQGVGLDTDKDADQNKLVEVLVVKDKYENLKSGRQFLYDTEVYLTVRKKDQQTITDDLTAQKAQVSMAIGTIIRQADPSYFQEATLATLRRQIKAMLDEHMGKDADGTSLVQDVLITRCIPFRGDF
ncbi:MAG: hypothetical protein GC162_12815 [Planctomycetes bacterium]|nr:hypothetical protein [Planctomycetota bacterium]